MSLYPQYARPRSVEQACQLLAGLSGGVVIIAGGQELLPVVNYGTLQPDVYVDIGGLDELRGISVAGDELVIGALTVHRDVYCNAEVLARAPLLAQSAAQIGGGWQVHNRGTIGGNIVAMHPLYDIAPVLLALQADVEIASAAATRRLSFAELLADTSHGLGSEALLTRIFIGSAAGPGAAAYYKLKNTSGAYGSANAAVVVQLDEGKLTQLRVAIGASADRLTLVDTALDDLLGRSFDDAMGAQLEQICAAAIVEPLSDHQGSAEWRRAMAGVVARRALELALTQHQHKGAI